jgi:hypothetical protein
MVGIISRASSLWYAADGRRLSGMAGLRGPWDSPRAARRAQPHHCEGVRQMPIMRPSKSRTFKNGNVLLYYRPKGRESGS